MKLVEEFVDDLTSIGTYDSFYDLMDEISYAWEPQYGMRKDESGVFVVHKLYIGKNWGMYKETYFKVAPGVYEDVEKFYNLVSSSKIEKK